MRICSFLPEHAAQAREIAKQNYQEAAAHIPSLPPIKTLPDLAGFAKNGLGVAAFEDGQMVGFLCVLGPFQNTFQSTDAVGVFSPLGANGAVGKNRSEIYAKMYQTAGEMWAKAGASSHSVCLYAHENEVQQQFFRYGFGMRCVDAVRTVEEISVRPQSDYEIAKLSPDAFLQVLPLCHLLDAHLAASPSFILRRSETPEEFLENTKKQQSIFLVAKSAGQIVAYLRAEKDGETFLSTHPGYLHINGAFCLPEHRGRGVYQNLLNEFFQMCKAENYTHLGVDFESINPAAYGFWLKYFDAYTHSLTRRIDEHVIAKST